MKVCHVKVNPGVVVGQNATFQDDMYALYPMYKTDMKTFSIPQGSSTQTIDDIFHGECPHKMVVGFVNSKAYVGNYHYNPFNFQHFNLNYLEFSKDGHSPILLKEISSVPT